jgi:type I restriction enzyme S subunit
MELPTGWVKQALGDVAKGRKGKLPKEFSDVPRDNFLPYIDIKNFERNILSRWASIDRATQVSDGDVLVVWDGSRFGLTGLGKKGVLGSTLVALQSAGAHPSYLKHFIDLNFQEINSRPRGTGTPHVDPEIFWNLKIPIAPLAEQRRIVDKIERLVSHLDEGERLLQQVQKQIATYRQAVLKAAVTGELTKEDIETWQEHSLGDLIEEIRYGTSKKCDRDNSRIPVLRIPNLTPRGIDFSDLKYAELSDIEQKKLALSDGDLLIIRSNGSVSLVGRCAIYRDQGSLCAFAGYLIRIRVDRSRIIPEFLNICLDAPPIRSLIERSARSTSGVHNINSDEIRGLPILLPSLESQQRIVDAVEASYSSISAVESYHSEGVAKLSQLRQSILKSAFAGQLVPQDPNDEPASVLLKRIQEEQRQATKSRPTRGRNSKKGVQV